LILIARITTANTDQIFHQQLSRKPQSRANHAPVTRGAIPATVKSQRFGRRTRGSQLRLPPACLACNRHKRHNRHRPGQQPPRCVGCVGSPRCRVWCVSQKTLQAPQTPHRRSGRCFQRHGVAFVTSPRCPFGVSLKRFDRCDRCDMAGQGRCFGALMLAETTAIRPPVSQECPNGSRLHPAARAGLSADVGGHFGGVKGAGGLEFDKQAPVA
jgi:hypothetical protein